MEYTERFYRRWSRPADLVCYEVKVKETDMLCCTSRDLRAYIEERVIQYRYEIESYIREHPIFLHSLSPLRFDPFAPRIVKEMMVASEQIGVGPMATVAGAIAEFVGRDIGEMAEDFILENGGDIFMRTRKERLVNIFCGDSSFGKRFAIRIRPGERPIGVCTSSGRIGHSISFGRAHAVSVIADSSLFADGVATYLGNLVKSKDDADFAIGEGRRFEAVKGIVVVVDDVMAVAGDLEIVEVQ